MPATPTYAELSQRIKALEREVARLRKTEADLRESQAQLAEIFSLSIDLLCIADIHTATFLKINPAFTKLLGYSENELLNRPFLEFVHPDDLEPTVEVMDERLKRGEKVINFSNRYRCADGTYRWLDWVSHPMPERGLSFAVAHDITDRMKYQTALEERERFIRTVMDNLPIGIAVNSVDPEVTFTYMNDNFARLYRTTREALADPDAFWEAVYEDPGFRKEMRERVLADCATGDPARMRWHDVPIARKGEPTTYITAMNTPVPESGLMISTVLDVTDRKNTEAALRETKRLLEETQAVAKLGGWEYDAILNRLSWTDEVYRIHGLEPDGASIDPNQAVEYYAPDHAPVIRQAFRRALKHGEPYDLELKIIRADGVATWIRTIGQPIRDSGKVNRVTGYIVDISERKRAEKEHEKLQTQLMQAQKMESVGRLAGGVAHDFNNMLGIILGHAELAMQELPTDAAFCENLRAIEKAARHSARLTRQLLAFARKQTIAPRPLDLNETIGKTLKMLRPLIGEDIEVAWKPGRGLWIVNADPAQIDQILTNLLVNARDAIDNRGIISIETDNADFDAAYCENHPGLMPGKFVMLAVSDNGRGMDRNTLNHLFEPFFTTKDAGAGTGLGLATVYGIVKQNNGFVNVYSEEGSGTTFRIYLPRHAADAIPTSPESPAPALESGTDTILLVEDDAMLLNLNQTLLQRIGYTVLTASTPSEAISRVEQYGGRIDLLITDVVMPEMNGKQLSERLSRFLPRLKCLFVSGYTADIIACQGVLEKGVHFLQKPISMGDLSAKVREVLEE